MKKEKTKPAIKNRIVGYGEESLENIVFNEKNWRIHPKNQQDALTGILEDVGLVQGVLINRRTDPSWSADQGIETLVDGHLRVTLADRAGEKTIPVTYVDLTPKEEAEILATLDPIGAMAAADREKMNELLADITTDDERVQALLASLSQPVVLPSEEKEEEPPKAPDIVFPSDNEWGVPSLLPTLQAELLVAPFAGWGTMARTSRMTGTWHFYVDDYRFENIWAEPGQLVATGCTAAVEPNFSTFQDMPPAVALYNVYRKRWIARWWQEYGVKIIVDLSVADRHAELNMMGVPHGWKAYATNCNMRRLELVEEKYRFATDYAGTKDILFVVFAGGKEAEKMARANGWIWYPGYTNKNRGLNDG